MPRGGTLALFTIGLVLASASAVLVVSGVRTLPTALVLAVALLLLLVGVVRTMAEQALRRAEARLVPPVPPPSPETLAELLTPIHACPACGTTDLLHAVHGHDGMMIECPRCTYVGEARVFSEKEEYAKYVQRLSH